MQEAKRYYCVSAECRKKNGGKPVEFFHKGCACKAKCPVCHQKGSSVQPDKTGKLIF